MVFVVHLRASADNLRVSGACAPKLARNLTRAEVAKGGSRTPKAFRLPDPKSGASASSATFANSGSELSVHDSGLWVRDALWYHPPPHAPVARTIRSLSRPFPLAHRARRTAARLASRRQPGRHSCPTTGRFLRIATLEAETSAICPSCAAQREGGFVSFVGDLRMAYACPECRELVWLAGA